MTSEERTRRLSWWEIIKWLLGSGIVITLIGGAWTLYQQSRPPSFEVSAIYTLDGSNQYETTDHWVGATPVPGVKMTWGLEAIPTYYGKPRGEVQVLVKGKSGQLLARESWSPFTKGLDPLLVQLDPFLITSELDHLVADYTEDNGDYTYPSTTLSIEIVEARNPSQPLYTDTLTILNTPWYHFTRASDSFLWEGHTTVEVFVRGWNLGAPSKFEAAVEIYDITDVSGKPFAPWPKVATASQAIKGDVDRDAEFATQITLPGNAYPAFEFEPGKCYGLNTYVIKEQNYAEVESSERWRFSDRADFTLVCFPTQ